MGELKDIWRNMPYWLNGAFVGLIIAFVVVINSWNFIGQIPIAISFICLKLLIMLLSSCDPKYGDFYCEEKLLPFIIAGPFLFILFCILIGVLIGFIIQKIKGKRIILEVIAVILIILLICCGIAIYVVNDIEKRLHESEMLCKEKCDNDNYQRYSFYDNFLSYGTEGKCYCRDSKKEFNCLDKNIIDCRTKKQECSGEYRDWVKRYCNINIIYIDKETQPF